MEDLKAKLEKAQALKRIGKRRQAVFEREVRQVHVLEYEVRAAATTLVEKEIKFFSSMRIRACLKQTIKSVFNELAEINIVARSCEDYQQQLRKELSASEAKVAQVKRAIREYQHGEVSDVEVITPRQERLWITSRALLKDYSLIEGLGWNSVFPPLWIRCGWRECFSMKSSLRKQFICKHLVARYFLHLDTKELEEEAKLWNPDNFACLGSMCRRKIQDLAAELVEDIGYAVQQRKSGDGYFWDLKKASWFREAVVR